MSDSLLRQWEILRALPRAPQKIDVAGLMETLQGAGYKTSKRSIQRDLNSLSRVFPLVSDAATGGLARSWSWETNAKTFDLPSMDGPTALALSLIEQLIPTLLPPSIRDLLAPQFERARTVLGADCVRVVPREMPLLAPRYDDGAVRVVYDALLAGKRFTADYRSRTKDTDDTKTYAVNPLGLVACGNLLYLVCTLGNHPDICQLALHRFTAATPGDQPATQPAGFNLGTYIQSGDFHHPAGPVIQLKAKFDGSAAAHLLETPLSDDQTITGHDAGHVTVTATVHDTAQLDWWLSAFGAGVEVQEPAELRQRMIESTISLFDLYSE